MGRKRRHGKGTPAAGELTAAGVPFAVHTYVHDPAAESFGSEAARALGVDAARVFKTLMVRLESVRGGASGTTAEEYATAVVPVTGRLDLKAAAAAFGAKRASLADPAVAERLTGYVLGGISPLGQRQRHRLALDVSALSAEAGTIFVSGGRRGLEIELAPADLLAVSGGTTAGLASG
ncbi:aminoacyl-tRNA deacylase [Zhihengliuella salsuginis]|uniref:Cys-tRNA(Pro)/Cys-tRNA(Cys) deacylase n=1 Tax=Zhihengliuella salsuginis TaxID=578222 RepID=A0ABQ3GDB7_9MICC|nr:aminoacyl-tRNA deacylase [Zhihengliuella salsuginis]GHD01320.1 Cys-tRNA(Pro)/Cys-tRNA(Cys) deacylase [Zhihengliuella salsuginis]